MMDKQEIKRALELHRLWLAGDAGGESVDLRGASLRSADLWDANLRDADLRGADLWSADLRGANLQDANLRGFSCCPEAGSFVGWKRLRNNVIAKLLIPEEARRTSSLVGRKCRAEFVEVLEGDGYDMHTGKLHYTPGKTVWPDSYDDDIRVECTHGIHFFITKQEAIDW